MTLTYLKMHLLSNEGHWYSGVNQQQDTVVFHQGLQIQSDHLNYFAN